ncbi:competence type IV pilus major pilin ComGC [Coraliomargarita parva]|uniref:competence type IV pilus major pilin ComGC n=1 Tax=Coraliomargarita parva TaxID=3014050 RepID=UPI0022B3A311|nr:type II secretion system protein [Coraliomargarita parva]
MKKNAAFTLIELLMVILIIGVLAGILIPAVGKVRSNATLTSCASNMRQMAVTMSLYANDHKLQFPAHSTPGHGVWSRVLVDTGYIQDPQVMACPADDYAAEAERPRSYVYASPAMFPANNRNLATTTMGFKSPADTFMLIEWHWPKQDYLVNGGAAAGRDSMTTSFVMHPDGVRNFAFVDGHVERLGIDDMRPNDSRWGSFTEQSGVQPVEP